MTKLGDFLSRRRTIEPRAKPSQPRKEDDYATHLYLGNLHISMGDKDQALAEYKRAYKLRPCDEIADLIASLKLNREPKKLNQTAPRVSVFGVA